MFDIDCFPGFRDRFRTAINVEGDSIGAGIVYHLGRKKLEEADAAEAAAREAALEAGSTLSSKQSVVSAGEKINGISNKAYEVGHDYEQMTTGL